MSKRKGFRLFLHGKGFLKSDQMLARFTFEDSISMTSTMVYKNACLMGTQIPDMGPDVPEGEHLVSVTVTLNGQQYSDGEKVSFLYKAVDPNLTEEELKKMDEEDAKAKGKPGGKKK